MTDTFDLNKESNKLKRLSIPRLIEDNNFKVITESFSNALKTRQTEHIHTIIQSTINIPDTIYNELDTIAIQCGKLQNFAYSSLSGIKNYLIVKDHKKFNKEIRDKWVSTGKFNDWGLQGRQSKEALRVCEGVIRSNWSNTLNRVEDKIKNNKELSNNEKRYCYSVLKEDQILFDILNQNEINYPKYLKKLNVDTIKLNKYLCRKIRQCKGKISHTDNCKTISMDSDMYSYKYDQNTDKLYIEVMGLTPNKRLRLEVKDKQQHSGTILIVLNRDLKEIYIHAASKIKVCKDKFNYTPNIDLDGLDKGVKHLITTSEGNFYGDNINAILTKQTEYQNDKNKKRNKIYNQIKKLEESGNIEDYKKAQRIRDNNFGRIKWNNQQRKYKEYIKAEINHSIYSLIQTERPAEIVLEKLNFQSWYKKLNSKVKRKLARWMKGYLDKRLTEIPRLYGINVTHINAAYTSQECSECGHLGVRNGDYFHCEHCGYKDNSDKNAAKVIKKRKETPEITLNMYYKDVKKIILARK